MALAGVIFRALQAALPPGSRVSHLAVFGIPWLEDASSSSLFSVRHVCPHLSLPVPRGPVLLA